MQHFINVLASVPWFSRILWNFIISKPQKYFYIELKGRRLLCFFEKFLGFRQREVILCFDRLAVILYLFCLVQKTLDSHSFANALNLSANAIYLYRSCWK